MPSGAVGIGLVNATSVPVALHVNDAWVGTYPAWSEQREIPIFGNGGPPWRVTFRGPEGFPVASLDLDAATDSAISEWRSDCGVLVTWSGSLPPDLPTIDPAATPPPIGPCA